MTTPVVRLARPADHASIAAFTQDTFAWGDYVGEAFLNWLDESDSAVFVAVDDDDRAIAVAHATRLSEREVWLGGARVHPDHKRRGVGATLNAACVEWGASWGAVVAGLLTEDSNVAARSQVAKLGYRQVAHLFYGHLDLDAGAADPAAVDLAPAQGPQPLNRAPDVDVEAAYATWAASELAQMSHSMIPVGWKVRRMGIDDLANAARAGDLFEAPAGWIVIQRSDAAAWIPWMVTIADEAFSFLRALAARLAADGIESIAMLLPNVPWLVAAAEQAGFSISQQTVWQREI